MKESPENPATNHLGAGLTDELVQTAVERSGYPLQTIVSDLLRKHFYVREEWSYLDRDTEELRSLDLLAERPLYDRGSEQPRVRPALDLLVECKQSQQPYIFFLTPGKHWLSDFPLICGLHASELQVTSDDDPSSWNFHVIQALELYKLPFAMDAYCSNTFSKVSWKKGGEAELSGSEAYNALILPLVKAMLHFEKSERPPDTAFYFDAHMVVALAVLDAPIVTAELTGGIQDLTLRPWVRVLRHEYEGQEHNRGSDRLRVVDVVHKDYLEAFVTKHLLPFAETYASLALKHQVELATGKAFISGMGKESWEEIEVRMRPRGVAAPIHRWGAVWRQLSKLFRRNT